MCVYLTSTVDPADVNNLMYMRRVSRLKLLAEFRNVKIVTVIKCAVDSLRYAGGGAERGGEKRGSGINVSRYSHIFITPLNPSPSLAIPQP